MQGCKIQKPWVWRPCQTQAIRSGSHFQPQVNNKNNNNNNNINGFYPSNQIYVFFSILIIFFKIYQSLY